MEAAGHDASQMGAFRTLIVLAGAGTNLSLPALIVLGLATRLAALGMSGFVIVQSLTDTIARGLTGGGCVDPGSARLSAAGAGAERRCRWTV